MYKQKALGNGPALRIAGNIVHDIFTVVAKHCITPSGICGQASGNARGQASFHDWCNLLGWGWLATIPCRL